MNAPKVSILIPTYNRNSLVKNAVLSALEQNYPSFEVIVCDDYSTDNTQSVIMEIESSRLRYYRNNKNLGMAGNYRRLTNELAKGEWMLILSDDDILTDNNFLTKAMLAYDKSDKTATLIAGGVWVKSGLTKSIWRVSRNIEYVDGVKLMLQWDFRATPFCSTLFRKRDFNNILFESNTQSSDWGTLLKLLLHGSAILLPDIVGVYLRHPSGYSSSIDNHNFAQNLENIHDPADYALSRNYDVQLIEKWRLNRLYRATLGHIGRNTILATNKNDSVDCRDLWVFIEDLLKQDKYFINLNVYQKISILALKYLPYRGLSSLFNLILPIIIQIATLGRSSRKI